MIRFPLGARFFCGFLDHDVLTLFAKTKNIMGFFNHDTKKIRNFKPHKVRNNQKNRPPKYETIRKNKVGAVQERGVSAPR